MEALWDMLLGYSHVPYALQHGTQCKFRGYCPQKKCPVENLLVYLSYPGTFLVHSVGRPNFARSRTEM